jgi:hypothetical protein
MHKTDKGFLACCLVFGLSGALLGYGICGTTMATAFGGGAGIAALPVLLILGKVFREEEGD